MKVGSEEGGKTGHSHNLCDYFIQINEEYMVMAVGFML